MESDNVINKIIIIETIVNDFANDVFFAGFMAFNNLPIFSKY